MSEVTRLYPSDSEDKPRLNIAESRTIKKKKAQQKHKPKTKASVAYGYTDSLNQRVWSGMVLASGPFLPRLQSQSVEPRFGNAVPSALDPVLTVANQITSTALVPTPRVQPSSNQTLPLRNEPGPVRKSLVITDE